MAQPGTNNGVQPPSPPSAAQAMPPPVAPDVQWSCKPSALSADGKPAGDISESLTVGQKFLLACEGPSVKLEASRLHLELPKEHKYVLRILQTKSLNETSAEFIATTYVAPGGELKFKNPVMSDGEKRVGMGDFAIPVQSVIKQEENPERKPFGPWSPTKIDWPASVYIAIAVLCVAVGTVIGLAIARSIERKRLLALLEKNAIALSPYNQFNKDLRQLNRQFTGLGTKKWGPETAREYIRDLNQSFRWFLTRELVIPALEARPARVLNQVSKVDKKLHKEVRKDLFVALNELKSALEAEQAASAEDAQQLSELCRTLADRVARARSA